jgi:hypothetical protein
MAKNMLEVKERIERGELETLKPQPALGQHKQVEYLPEYEHEHASKV